jgi:hypothetical protein
MRSTIAVAVFALGLVLLPTEAWAGRRGSDGPRWGTKDDCGCEAEKVAVPQMVGLTTDDALRALRRAGIVCSSHPEKGSTVVTKQMLPCGTLVPRNHPMWIQ